MEHIEEAGVHSGDSACCIPPHSLAPETITVIKQAATSLAKSLGVVGLMNVQFAVKREEAGPTLYVIEVNPRASRTVPFVAKATGVPVAKIALDFQGKLPMSVVSGGTRKNVLRTLKAIGMADFFEAVITADDGLRPKPDPQMFIEAAKRMGVSAESCQVFEDGDPGIQAARAAGMPFVDVRPYVNL